MKDQEAAVAPALTVKYQGRTYTMEMVAGDLSQAQIEAAGQMVRACSEHFLRAGSSMRAQLAGSIMMLGYELRAAEKRFIEMGGIVK